MSESFAARLLRVRLSKNNGFRVLSQERAARIFNVSLSCYRMWEKGGSFPLQASRDRMMDLWPEVFAKEFIIPPR